MTEPKTVADLADYAVQRINDLGNQSAEASVLMVQLIERNDAQAELIQQLRQQLATEKEHSRNLAYIAESAAACLGDLVDNVNMCDKLHLDGKLSNGAVYHPRRRLSNLTASLDNAQWSYAHHLNKKLPDSPNLKYVNPQMTNKEWVGFFNYLLEHRLIHAYVDRELNGKYWRIDANLASATGEVIDAAYDWAVSNYPMRRVLREYAERSAPAIDQVRITLLALCWIGEDSGNLHNDDEKAAAFNERVFTPKVYTGRGFTTCIMHDDDPRMIIRQQGVGG